MLEDLWTVQTSDVEPYKVVEKWSSRGIIVGEPEMKFSTIE